MFARRELMARWHALSRESRLAILIWTVLLVTVSVRVFMQPGRNSVFPIFATAGSHWLAGSDVYGRFDTLLDQFRYAPVVAVWFAAWDWLPHGMGELFWRALNVGVLAFGFIRFARILVDRIPLLPFSLFMLPLFLGSLNNGQSNLLVLGMLLLALAAAHRERWWLCAVCLAVPILFKIYPLAPALLLVLLAPARLAPRLALVVSAGFLLPFALGGGDYVAQQYVNWIVILGTDDRQAWGFAAGYRDVHMLLRFIGMPPSPAFYLSLQLLSAAGLAALVVLGVKRGWSRGRLLRAVLDLGCCWIVLFGPATESSTYALLGPTLAFAVWEARGRSVWTGSMMVAIVALFVSSVIITALPGGKEAAFFLSPLAALLLFAERLWHLREPRATTLAPTAAPALAGGMGTGFAARRSWPRLFREWSP